MPPVGPAMDALVAEALGYSDRKVAAGVPPFSGYSAAAMRALEAWREQHPGKYRFGIDLPAYAGNLYIVTGMAVRQPQRDFRIEARTLEAAICQAIIRAQWALEDAG